MKKQKSKPSGYGGIIVTKAEDRKAKFKRVKRELKKLAALISPPKERKKDAKLVREIVNELVPRALMTVAHPSGRKAETATFDHRQPERRTKKWKS